MVGTLQCTACGTEPTINRGTILLRCRCGGRIEPGPGRSSDQSPHGVPSLAVDLVARFGRGPALSIADGVAGYHAGATSRRDGTESILGRAVARYGGALHGLEHAVKTPASLHRKIEDRFTPELLFAPGSAVTDTLRFTVVVPPEDYAEVTQDLLWFLQDGGEQILDEENSWGRGDPYSALHYVLRTVDDWFYELQVHTPASYQLKVSRLHRLYEEFRNRDTALERRRELWRLMADEWDDVDLPDDIIGFGGPEAVEVYPPPE